MYSLTLLGIVAAATLSKRDVVDDFVPLPEMASKDDYVKMYQPGYAIGGVGCNPSIAMKGGDDAFVPVFNPELELHCNDEKLANVYARKGKLDPNGDDGNWGIVYAYLFAHDQEKLQPGVKPEAQPQQVSNVWHYVIAQFSDDSATIPDTYTAQGPAESKLTQDVDHEYIESGGVYVVQHDTMGFKWVSPDDTSIPEYDKAPLLDWDLMPKELQDALTARNWGTLPNQKFFLSASEEDFGAFLSDNWIFPEF
ncbi:hypothetical protein MRB53_039152 [Persea americana]|nr:hypothetical protein MRB53_039152 [Persea americana]